MDDWFTEEQGQKCVKMQKHKTKLQKNPQEHDWQ